VSWIHSEDFVRAVIWLIEREDLEGAVNVAAPHPLPNDEFMRTLREAAGVRVGLPASGILLEAGAWLLRSETELILKSRRVVPRRLLEDGFAFRYPHWSVAARDLCRQWSVARRTGRMAPAAARLQ
jgi:NAD dependent epimerase/dehydratase family enzyme